MVSAATDMFPAKARETLAAHPELLAALARGDFDFDCDGVAETTLDEDPARDDSDSSSSDASVHVALGALVDRHVAASLAFLGDEAGVPPAALGALVAAHPTVLSASVPERLRPAWAFLRRPANRGGCGLSPREAVDAAANDPTMLTRDVATSLEPALAVLVEDVGVRPRDAAGMGMLRRDVAERASRAAAFFAVECGLGSVAAKALARRDPRVVLRDVDAAYRPTLEVMRETGMSLDDIAKVVAKAPGALAQSSPARVRRKLAFFAEAPCRLGADGAARVVAQWPTALTLSVENNLAPTHAFLASELGLGETGVRAVLLKCPNVFGLTRATIRDKFAFLADKFLGAANAVAMVTRMPALLTISLENNLEPTAAFLLEACEEMLERDEGREDGSVDGSESVSEREAAEGKKMRKRKRATEATFGTRSRSAALGGGGDRRRVAELARDERRAKAPSDAGVSARDVPVDDGGDGVQIVDVQSGREHRAAAKLADVARLGREVGPVDVPRVDRRRVLRERGRRQEGVRRRGGAVPDGVRGGVRRDDGGGRSGGEEERGRGRRGRTTRRRGAPRV
jgi:hypothetical protein